MGRHMAATAVFTRAARAPQPSPFFRDRMLKMGLLVGVPLTLLQAEATRMAVGVAALPSAQQVALNVALSSAVYDHDRLPARGAPLQRALTRASAAYAASCYAAVPALWPMLPLLYVLHFGYADLKPTLGPWKPVFVGVAWMLATYASPMLYAGTVDATWVEPAYIVAAIATLSHFQDIPDRAEDELQGVRTVAVQYGEEVATAVGIAASLVTVALHLALAGYDPVRDGALDGALLLYAGDWAAGESAGAAGRRSAASALAASALVATLVDGGTAWIASGEILRMTEGTHAIAIELSVRIGEWVRMLPPPVSDWLKHALVWTLHAGDEVGSRLLQLYVDRL